MSQKIPTNVVLDSSPPWAMAGHTLIYLLVVSALLSLALIVDRYPPPGAPHGMLYVLAILLCSVLTRSKAMLWAVVGVTCATAVLGGVLNPNVELTHAPAILSRVLAVVIIVLAGILIHINLGHQESNAKARKNLSKSLRDLKLNRKLLDVASETTRFGGFAISLPDRHMVVSAHVMEIFGNPPTQKPDFSKVLGYYLPPYREKIQTAYGRCRDEGIPYDLECEILTAKNERLWIRSTGRPELDAQGNIKGICGSVQDVTPFKVLEKSLQDSKARFRSMASSLPVIVWTADRTGELNFMNDIACELLGIGFHDTTEKKSFDGIMHPEDFKRFSRKWHSSVSGGAYEFNQRARLKLGNGDYCWHLINARSNYALHEEDASQWFGVAIDIDKLVHAQKKQSSMSLLMERTFESITDIFFTVDRDWKFTFLNSRAADFFDSSAENIIGCISRDSLISSLGEDVFEKLSAIESNSEFDSFDAYIEATGLYLSCSAYALDGEGFIFYIQDVTEQKQLERQLVKTQQSETIGLLTGGVAHDFNNLLTIITGNADMLGQKLDPDSQLAELARSIQSAAGRGSKLVKELLAYARNQPLQTEIVDVNELVRGFSGLLGKSLTQSVKLDIRYADDLQCAEIDPVQLENVILNLCMNSMQAMTGGGSIVIETDNIIVGKDKAASFEEFEPGEYVTISVSDTGRGIPKADVEKIFQPFYTTKKTGTGLGLSMVYGFIKQSGGHVTVYSEENQGTTIRLYLPKARDGLMSSHDDIPLPVLAGKGEGTILLADDENLIREYALSVLEHAGYKVLLAADGREAMEHLESRELKIDLLLTDIIMPGEFNGAQLKDRALELYPDIRVLIASGFPSGILAFDIEQSSPRTDYITKPYQREELLSKVSGLLFLIGEEASAMDA